MKHKTTHMTKKYFCDLTFPMQIKSRIKKIATSKIMTGIQNNLFVMNQMIKKTITIAKVIPAQTENSFNLLFVSFASGEISKSISLSSILTSNVSQQVHFPFFQSAWSGKEYSFEQFGHFIFIIYFVKK